MSYKITIIDNDNGNVILDESEAVAIIGAVSNEEDTAEIGFTDCNGVILAQALDAADGVISTIEERSPQIAILRALRAIKRNMCDISDKKGDSEE